MGAASSRFIHQLGKWFSGVGECGGGRQGGGRTMQGRVAQWEDRAYEGAEVATVEVGVESATVS